MLNRAAPVNAAEDVDVGKEEVTVGVEEILVARAVIAFFFVVVVAMADSGEEDEGVVDS